MKKSIFLSVFLFVFILTVKAQEVYITPNGTASPGDSNAGTISNPYNLQTGFANAGNGDTLLLDGIFDTTTTIFLFDKQNLTIGVVEGKSATIRIGENLVDGNGVSSLQFFTINQSNNITIRDISFEGSADESSSGYSILNFDSTDNLTLENITISRNWGLNGIGLNIFGEGKNIVVRGCTFFDMGWTMDTNISPRFVTGQDGNGDDIYGCHSSVGAIVQGNRNDGSYSNITFNNNSFSGLITGCSESLIIIGNVAADTNDSDSFGFLIKDNTFLDNKNIGVAVAGHYDYVEECDYSTSPATCVPLNEGLNQARNGIVTGNRVERSIFANNEFTAAGIYCDGCHDVIIERNIVKESGAGISIGCENGGGLSASNVTVINNILKENIDAGLFLGSRLNEDNTGQTQSIVENSIIRNNVFYKNGTNTNYFLNQEAFIGRSDNTEFFNNILYIDNNAQGVISAALTSNGNPTFQEVTNFTLNHNLYYRDNGDIDDFVVSFGSTLPNPQNAQFDNPDFIDTTNDDFRISLTSIAANTGNPSTSLTTGELDFYGNNRLFGMTNIDMGVHESESTLSASSLNLAKTIKIYPTLVENDLTLKIESASIKEIKVNIYGLNGAKVMNSKTIERRTTGETTDFDLSQLSSGLYIIEVVTSDALYRQKIIKQ